MTNLTDIRETIRAFNLIPEARALRELQANSGISDNQRQASKERAVDLVNAIRSDSSPALMEVFLAEYGLSTDEGVALMCLAEALLRVPDAETIDALIEDKIAPSAWGEHLGQSSSSLVNASTWALMLTGHVLKEGDGKGIASVLRGAVKRLGRTGDPDRGGSGDQGNGAPVCAGAHHQGGGETRCQAADAGLYVFLRHAGRGGADQTGCGEVFRCLFGRDRQAGGFVHQR